jgi:hypothetical protein
MDTARALLHNFAHNHQYHSKLSTLTRTLTFFHLQSSPSMSVVQPSLHSSASCSIITSCHRDVHRFAVVRLTPLSCNTTIGYRRRCGGSSLASFFWCFLCSARFLQRWIERSHIVSISQYLSCLDFRQFSLKKLPSCAASCRK